MSTTDDELARVTAERDHLQARCNMLTDQATELTRQLLDLHMVRLDETTTEMMKLAHEVTGDPRPFREWAASQMAERLAAARLAASA